MKKINFDLTNESKNDTPADYVRDIFGDDAVNRELNVERIQEDATWIFTKYSKDMD